MPADTATQVRLFISYKPEDFEAAHQIAAAMRFIGRDRLSVSVCEDPPAGLDFFTSRLKELALADMLLLLYTDPNQDWNLCVYESGFFSGRYFPDHTKRLVVLHSDDVSTPSPLDQFESVAVSPSHRTDLERFIRGLFADPVRDGMDPVYPGIMGDEMKPFRTQLEDTIVNAVSGPQETRVFVKEICIEVPAESLRKTQDATTNDMPGDARVFADRASFELFGLNESPTGYPWKVFYDNMDRTSANTEEWADALVYLLANIAFSPKFLSSTGLPLYRSSRGAEADCYRPAVRSFRRKKDLLSFRVMFVDLPRETLQEEEGAATSLAQVLTLGRMLRSGVLFPFRDRLDSLERESQLRSEQGVAPGVLAREFEHFRENISTVYVEARNRGYQRTDMLHYFGRDGAREKLDALIKRWDILLEEFKVLPDRLKHGGAGIDAARQVVNEAIDINKQYMLIFAQRYKEVIEQW